MSEPDPVPTSEEELMMRRMAEQGGSEPDGPVGTDDGYTDGGDPHDVENCNDPRCENQACLYQRKLRDAEERYEARVQEGGGA